MRLRPLLLSLAVLAPLAAAAWWLGRPAPHPSAADPRIGQRLAEPAALADAARLRLTTDGQTLAFSRHPSGRWVIDGTPALPADLSRLTRLGTDLLGPKIERLVSANPEKIATYDLASASLAYLDASGQPLLDLRLGKTTEGGGRILAFGDEKRAYLARLNLSLDASASSWRDTALLPGLAAADLASLGISFPDTKLPALPAAPVVLSRKSATEPWTSPAAPAGHQVKASVLTSQTGNLSTLRYTEVAPVIDPAVVAARVFSREITLTTFSGRTITLAFARAPEPPAPPAPEVKEGETAPPPPPAAPRPVYVTITDSSPDPILAEAAKTHAFEIAEWLYTALPAQSSDLFEPVPTPPAAPPAEPISVTTPPITVPTP